MNNPSNVPHFLRKNQEEELILFPDEPRQAFQAKDLDRLLIWASEVGASDITIQSDEQVFLETGSGMHRATRRVWSNDEVLDGLAHMFGNASIKSRMSDARDSDFAYDLRPERNRRFRFRVNATGILTNGKPGVQITMRTIPSLPPKMSELGLEDDIIANIAPRQGMILLTGATGSGKTTLLAAAVREMLEDPKGNRKIITGESPIEFVFDEVVRPTTSIAQSEIGRNLESFTAFIRGALRRKPSIILLGEARDAETIGEAIVASQTGHLVLTTAHTNGFAETIRRMVSVFGENERNARAVDLISALRMTVSQTLVPGKHGGRVAIREYVVMNEEIVETLLDSDLDRLSLTSKRVLDQHGQSFLKAAQRAYEEDRITAEVLKRFQYGERASKRDVVTAGKALEAPNTLAHHGVGVVGAEDPLSPSVGVADSRLNDLEHL